MLIPKFICEIIGMQKNKNGKSNRNIYDIVF